MEDHLKNKDRLDREWEGLCAYEAEPCSHTTATLSLNMAKNRYQDVLPYDHSRVVLAVDQTSGQQQPLPANGDFINASTIVSFKSFFNHLFHMHSHLELHLDFCTKTDHDPRNPAYIAAQGPLTQTTADFWQVTIS